MDAQIVNPEAHNDFQEEEGDEFRSCCEDEESWHNPEEELEVAMGNCCICFEDKPLKAMRCNHTFCSSCITLYIKEKQRSSQVPIKCPNWECKSYIQDSIQQEIRGYSAYQKRSEEYEMGGCDEDDSNLINLAERKRWRRCGECGRMIELWEGCNHMTCWCGYEFCYACGKEYRDGRRTCECAFWDDAEEVSDVEHSVLYNAYEYEGSQFGFIETLVFGGSSAPDFEEQRLCNDGYVDVIRDIGYVPWLEKLVSVISDSYYNDYI